jgi:hypothetical protein
MMSWDGPKHTEGGVGGSISARILGNLGLDRPHLAPDGAEYLFNTLKVDRGKLVTGQEGWDVLAVVQRGFSESPDSEVFLSHQ